jgi:hypothetical protein
MQSTKDACGNLHKKDLGHKNNSAPKNQSYNQGQPCARSIANYPKLRIAPKLTIFLKKIEILLQGERDHPVTFIIYTPSVASIEVPIQS